MIRKENINFKALVLPPNPKEVSYWIDLGEDPAGTVIKTYTSSKGWVALSGNSDNSDADIDLSQLQEELADYVDQKIGELVGTAPEALDTLYEIAEALNNDADFATTVATQIGQKLDTSVYEADKETFALKTEIPTKTSDLSNDSDYQTTEDVAGYITNALTILDEYQSKLVSGTNIKTINGISVLGSGDIVTPDTTYGVATTSVSGLMSAVDKAKLDGISEHADVTTVTQITTTGTEIASINGTTIYAPVTETGDLDLSDYVTQTELTSTLVDYAKTSDIPVNLSDLTNDSGYITSSALSGYAQTSDIPTNVSQLTNDSGYITSSALSDYAKTTDIPDTSDMLTKTEAATTYQPIGDYALKSEIPTVPTNISAFTNDSNFVVGASVSNIAAVSELPASPDDNTLYLIVSE